MKGKQYKFKESLATALCSAIPNLMFGNYTIFYIGLAYQAIVFVICMYLALRLFKSDKILTTSLNLGQKSKYKKVKKS